MKTLKYLSAILCFLCTTAMFAHGDLHARILKLSKQIEKNPDSAELYFHRGKLHYQHETYNKSLSDLKKAEKLGLNGIEVNFQFAQTYLKLGQHTKSISRVDEILKIEERHVRALKIKAQNQFLQNKFNIAALTFEQVIDYSSGTIPENYIDAAIAWESTETDLGLKNAEIILRRGIAELGNIVSLYIHLETLFVRQNRFDEAITVREEIISFIPRKEASHFRLYELHTVNGNSEEAKRNLDLSKQRIQDLPVRLKSTAYMKDLIQKITSIEKELQQNN
ncbi:MAG: hypothetical protein KJO00_08180 [Bacteroidia bacterium]|nr:hypothetical protein [Bacteroidia bacterium]MBT8287984.1 hypothetical protein [Bacteroidia bacterium]NNK72603.1 hypothetical protein [Flavobacteriaceae bacterium]